MKRGFTLVELSIVLVIIGLLIGGILVAESMISSSKLTSQVSQIQQLEVGFMNFKTTHKELPGDAPAFGGNGDKVLTSNPSVGIPNDSYVFEVSKVWGNIFPEQYPSNPFQYKFTPQPNVPMAKIGRKGTFVLANSRAENNHYNAITVKPEHYFTLIMPATLDNVPAGYATQTRFPATTSLTAAVTPAELLSLDKKLDDGIANSGNVLSGNISNGTGQPVGSINILPLATCSVGTDYKTTSTYECTPLIRIGGAVGDPQ